MGQLCRRRGPVATGYILTWGDGNWDMTFYVSAAIYLMGIVCWTFLDSGATLANGDSSAAATAA